MLGSLGPIRRQQPKRRPTHRAGSFTSLLLRPFSPRSLSYQGCRHWVRFAGVRSLACSRSDECGSSSTRRIAACLSRGYANGCLTCSIRFIGFGVRRKAPPVPRCRNPMQSLAMEVPHTLTRFARISASRHHRQERELSPFRTAPMRRSRTRTRILDSECIIFTSDQRLRLQAAQERSPW